MRLWEDNWDDDDDDDSFSHQLREELAKHDSTLICSLEMGIGMEMEMGMGWLLIFVCLGRNEAMKTVTVKDDGCS